MDEKPELQAPLGNFPPVPGDLPPPKPKMRHYAAMIFVTLLIVGIALPSGGHTSWIFWPIIIAGAATGIDFLVRCVMYAKRAKNPLVKVFSVLVGLGLGGVIFFVGFIAGIMVYFKDASVQSS